MSRTRTYVLSPASFLTLEQANRSAERNIFHEVSGDCCVPEAEFGLGLPVEQAPLREAVIARELPSAVWLDAAHGPVL